MKINPKTLKETRGGADLDRKEVIDEWQKHHVLTVPHLFAVDLDSASQLPPLTTVLHKDLSNVESECVYHM